MRQRVASISHELFLQIWILDLLMSYSVIGNASSCLLLKLVLRDSRALDTASRRVGITKDRIYAMNTWWIASEHSPKPVTTSRPFRSPMASQVGQAPGWHQPSCLACQKTGVTRQSRLWPWYLPRVSRMWWLSRITLSMLWTVWLSSWPPHLSSIITQ